MSSFLTANVITEYLVKGFHKRILRECLYLICESSFIKTAFTLAQKHVRVNMFRQNKFLPLKFKPNFGFNVVPRFQCPSLSVIFFKVFCLTENKTAL